MNWKQFTIIRPLVYYTTGILAFHYPFSPILWSIVLIILILPITKFKMLRSGESMVYTLIFLGLGYATTHFNLDINKVSHFQNLESIDSLFVQINEVKKTTNAYQLSIYAKSAFSNKLEKSVSGNAIIYVKEAHELSKGMVISIPNKFQRIQTYKNPDKFDFGTYLSQKNIYYSSFLNQDEITIIRPPKLFRRYLHNIEKGIQRSFENHLKTKNLPLIYALILGDRDEMSQNQRSLFTDNGLAHLLAVSGMHVGIIILLLNFITKPVRNKVLQTVICLVITWIYIIITGSQTPAVRAGFMFSVYQFGLLNFRTTRPLNNVFFSAFVLLAIEPKALFQASFQLSFIAMISILFFMPKIQALFHFKTKIFNSIWQLVALSISVQLLVAPISIYYFHQYPLYGIINSVVATPFIIIIIWVGIIFLVIQSIFPFLGVLIGKLLDFCISIFLQINEFLNQLPFAQIKDLEISEISLFLWMMGVLGFTYFLKNQFYRPQIAAMCFVPLFIFQPLHEMGRQKGNIITIYDHPSTIVIDILENGETYRIQSNPPTKKDQYYVPPIQDYSIKSTVDINKLLANYGIMILSGDKNEDINYNNMNYLIIPRSLNIKSINQLINNHSAKIIDIKEKGFFTLNI